MAYPDKEAPTPLTPEVKHEIRRWNSILAVQRAQRSLQQHQRRCDANAGHDPLHKETARRARRLRQALGQHGTL